MNEKFLKSVLHVSAEKNDKYSGYASTDERAQEKKEPASVYTVY